MGQAVLGIDPGKNGGFAVVNAEGRLVLKAPMPARGKSIDALDVRDIILDYLRTYGGLIAVERVQGFARDSGSNAFWFGHAAGVLSAALEEAVEQARSAPAMVTYVEPGRWQRRVFTAAEPPQLKSKARCELAFQRIFPYADVRPTAKCKLHHPGVVAAALIAWASWLELNHGQIERLKA